MSAPNPSIRVVVRLPYNRPEQPIPDPPRIEWNAAKENMLWEVIARSRAADSGGTDWAGLSAHLDVPLPYLLYRAQIRYEEDLRGIQDIKGAFSPLGPVRPPSDEPFGPNVRRDSDRSADRPVFPRLEANRAGASGTVSSALLTSPLSVRARVSSLNANTNPTLRAKKATSSSTLTLKGSLGRRTHVPFEPTSPISSNSDSSEGSGDEASRENAAERAAEQDLALEKKLKDLERMMTGDALGLVRNPSGGRRKAKQTDRGRASNMPLSASVHMPIPTADSFRMELPPPRARYTLSASESTSRSRSDASVDSPQGSVSGGSSQPRSPVPSIASPPDSQRSSPISVQRHLSPGKSGTSPPAISPRSAHGMRFQPMLGRATSEHGSNQGSAVSSFSDISESLSLSSSALDSAMLSNIRGRGSRSSARPRSRYSSRTNTFS